MNNNNATYIATFFSHYGALQYCKFLHGLGVVSKPMPVPRSVSSSCGTCVSYNYSAPIDSDDCELECIYLKTKHVKPTFECVLRK